MNSPMEFCSEHNQLEPCPLCAGHSELPPTTSRNYQRPPGLITDRELAIAVRAALLSIVDAIERRYNIRKRTQEKPINK